MNQGQYYAHWTQVPEFLWSMTPNFHPTTDQWMVSPDSGEFYFHIPSMRGIQRVRDIRGMPVRLNSGRRSEVWNAHVGGEPGSMHFKKIAWDIDFHHKGHDPLLMRDAILKAGFTGIGYYRTFIHADMGKKRWWYGSRAAKKFWEGLQTPEIVLS